MAYKYSLKDLQRENTDPKTTTPSLPDKAKESQIKYFTLS